MSAIGRPIQRALSNNRSAFDPGLLMREFRLPPGREALFSHYETDSIPPPATPGPLPSTARGHHARDEGRLGHPGRCHRLPQAGHLVLPNQLLPSGRVLHLNLTGSVLSKGRAPPRMRDERGDLGAQVGHAIHGLDTPRKNWVAKPSLGTVTWKGDIDTTPVAAVLHPSRLVERSMR